MAGPDHATFESTNGALAMRVMPGLLAQTIHGSVNGEDFDLVAEPAFNHPLLGDRFVVVCRIAPKSVRDAPDDGFREAAAAQIKRHAGRLRGFAFVVVGSTLLGATARAVISGISLLSRSPHPEKAFKDIDEAARWLHSLHPEGRTPEEIVGSVDALVGLWTARAAD